ncbi:hypothetical protein R1sor_022124 [Riccia sorocarpa]|uniref:RNA polymerase II subunit 5-mediating protein n=1 Tax=Riccia sorocarpa TaxID=122646 RepID=A0ABD3GIZ2_9MARC
MTSETKGTVVPLADTISVTEAEKVAKQVKDEIEKQQDYLRELHGYRDETRVLSKLVTGLPDSVSYNIMVPFGKAAFFPGRLIHTNEFLVLLGEGYYSERSAKQTVGILERRDAFLLNKIENVKSHVADLEAEAAFASNTAAEAKAGVVEIREEILEEADPKKSAMTVSDNFDRGRSKLQNEERHLASSSRSSVEEDEEHSRIMARIEALEAAEEAARPTSDEEDTTDEEESTSIEEDVDDVEAITKAGSYLSKEQKANLINRLNRSGTEAEDYDGENSDEGSGSGSEEDEEEAEEEYDLEEDEGGEEEDKTRTEHALNVGPEPVRSDQGKALNEMPAEGSRKHPRTLSRFGREVQVKERLDSELASRALLSQSGGLVEKFAPWVDQKDASCSGLEVPDIRGQNELQKELTEWRTRDSEMQGFVLGREVESSGTVQPKDEKIVQKLERPAKTNTVKSTEDQKSVKPATTLNQAFTGTVTEHVARPTIPDRTGSVNEQRAPVRVQGVAGQVEERSPGPSSKSEQVEEPPAKPVSRFKQMRQSGR